MATYVVYERATGKVVHTHVQPDDRPISREVLLALSAPGQDPAKLATLLVDPADIKGEGLYRVDPNSKELQAADEKTATGFGIATARNMNSAWPIGPFKIIYSSGEAAEGEER